MGITVVEAADAKALRLPAEAWGFKLPYFDVEGHQTKFFRVRYMEDTRKGFDKLTTKKPLKYGQPGSTVNEVYFPPFAPWAQIVADVGTALIITEGELKAACATKHGFPTIGLGGVWCFQSKKSGTPLLEQLESIQWKGRTVYIVFDSDAVTNPDVLAAERRLAQRLLERGAEVYIGRLTQGYRDGDVSKVGVDDFIVLNGAEQFQTQVIDTAFEFEQSSVLHDLNMRCVYVRDPGFVWDRNARQKITPGAFIQHAFANLHYWETRGSGKNGTTLVKLPAAKAWIEWEYRTECKGLIYAPGQPDVTEEGLLNTWQPWGIPEPLPGSIEPWNHLLNHLFGSDKDARRWFEAWCAYPLQNPGAKMATAALLWGITHGSGKTLVGHTLMRIYGKNAAEIHDYDIDDERKEWAADKQFVLVDDIVAKGDRKLMRMIMTLITQKTVRLNPKFIPSYFIPDTINYLYTSNEPDALYMDDDDRRFFIHEVMAGKYIDYKRYVAWRDSDAGIAALWHHLLTMDISWFDPQAPAPTTEGKNSMQELGKSDLGRWVRELRDNGAALMEKHGLKGDLASIQELHAMYDPSSSKNTTVNALARELKRSGFKPPATGSKLRLPDGTMKMVYAVRNISQWQEAGWAEACAHYAKSRPEFSKKPKM